jgi:hypothetical protein
MNLLRKTLLDPFPCLEDTQAAQSRWRTQSGDKIEITITFQNWELLYNCKM